MKDYNETNKILEDVIAMLKKLPGMPTEHDQLEILSTFLPSFLSTFLPGTAGIQSANRKCHKSGG